MYKTTDRNKHELALHRMKGLLFRNLKLDKLQY